MRLRKKPWIIEAIKEYENVLIRPEDCREEVFGRVAPLHVELGSGKGRFINGLAARHPETNFIGIEAQLDIIYYAAQKAAEGNLSNLRLMLFDATGIDEVFSPGEISRLYINFCDPWPKNRHAKRRLTHSGFLAKYRKILAKGGELFFKTDNVDLFEFSLNEFADAKLTVRNITFDLHGDSSAADNVMTEYEAKFSALGMKICRCEVIFD